MSTPISRRQMLRRLLLAALEDVAAPDEIRFWEPGEAGPQPTMTLTVGSTAAARAWSAALDLESGQPSPLTAPQPSRWTGALVGDVAGWNVHLQIDEPYTAEHEARWLAKEGLRQHPRSAECGRSCCTFPPGAAADCRCVEPVGHDGPHRSAHTGIWPEDGETPDA